MDICIGIATVVVLAVGLFALGLRLTGPLSNRVTVVIELLIVISIVLYARALCDSALLARVLPFSNVIVLGNWLPLFAGFLAGVAWRHIPGRVWRRCVTVVPLVLVATYCAYGGMLAPPPQCGDQWENVVCMQTTASSCGAAAAATLLRAHGVPATEDEMAALCLTTEHGTALHGLYRGLKIKTAGTGWDVEAFSCDLDGVRRMTGPLVLRVGAGERANTGRRGERQWFQRQGVGHCVVLFGFTRNGKIEVGDPSVGRELWDIGTLAALWDGEGLRLVRRNGR